MEERKTLLVETLAVIDSPYINLIPYVHTKGEQLFKVMKANNIQFITCSTNEALVEQHLLIKLITQFRNQQCKDISFTNSSSIRLLL